MTEYFSYGSNLDQESLDIFCQKVKRPLIPLRQKNPKHAVLKGYRLDFNYYSPLMGGGAANLEPDPREEVEGIVFTLTDEDMETLDLRERAPDYFKRILVTVVLNDGRSLEGIVAYCACEGRKAPYTPPIHEYKSSILKGAEAFDLSPSWLTKLRNIPSQDPKFNDKK